MDKKILVERKAFLTGEELGGLSDLLTRVVESGASVGFLPPLPLSAASAYWKNVICDDTILFIAKAGDKIAGTVQLQLCPKQNGLHRAEIAKLMTHPLYQRRGIGRLLMKEAEQWAKMHQRTLLVLDTREGDVSNRLYQSLGYTEAGKIPNYARSQHGGLDTTVLYYKWLSDPHA
ncbi:GNAT family N-acetyltransferase [Heyndrickxia coagulans]|uniref:GNAT family N-acetyltransferase n=1 Tax=Heyndrickxia coagulans TaxID=1398 RepID=UPI00062876A0|nr:GNAT family N-acetyltransferase [Heyndrickxia coagulans]